MIIYRLRRFFSVRIYGRAENLGVDLICVFFRLVFVRVINLFDNRCGIDVGRKLVITATTTEQREGHAADRNNQHERDQRGKKDRPIVGCLQRLSWLDLQARGRLC